MQKCRSVLCRLHPLRPRVSPRPLPQFPLRCVPADLRENLEEILPQLQAEHVRCFYLGLTSPTPGVEALEPTLDAAPTDPVPADLRAGITRKSPALFIYTSGTTGEGTRQPCPNL